MVRMLAMGLVAAGAAGIAGLPERVGAGDESAETWTFHVPESETPVELAKGNPLRGELFDVVRPYHERATKRSVKFDGGMWAFRNWAVFVGQSVDGKSGERLVADLEMGSSDVAVLWLRTFEGWKVVDYSFGHTDAFFVDWPSQFGVPEALLNAMTGGAE